MAGVMEEGVVLGGHKSVMLVENLLYVRMVVTRTVSKSEFLMLF